MKILLLRGNPRKTGFTQCVTDWFVQGLHETDAQVTDVDVTSLAINPCLGCYECWLATPGQCVHDDGMKAMLTAVLDTDVIVCATPVYYFTMSSQMKLFIERLFPLFLAGIEPSGLGRVRNRIRYPEKWQNKKLISIVTGSMPGQADYEPVNQTFRLIADGCGLELGGQLTRPETYLLKFTFSKPKATKWIEQAFVEAGREAGRQGRLSAKVVEQAAWPLTASPEHFQTYGNIYWEHAVALGSAATDLEVAQSCVADDPRIIMREMARCADAAAIAMVQAVLQFDFPDRHLHFRMTLDQGQCALAEKATEAPDLRISCDSTTWLGILTRRVDVRESLRKGQLTVTGNHQLFMQLGRFFPLPVA